MKRSEAAELVMMLMGAFPAGKTNESTSQIYEQMLADLDVTRARRAVTKLIASSKFLPTISEIREECGAAPLLAPYHREWKPPLPSGSPRRLPPADATGPVQQRPIGPATIRLTPSSPRAPERAYHRVWTAEELEAELAKTGREK